MTYAGLVNAVKMVGKDLDKVKVAMLGAGASNIAIARVCIAGGVEMMSRKRWAEVMPASRPPVAVSLLG